jgi:hypothetical protein
MLIFTHQCPHCATDHIGLKIVNWKKTGEYRYVTNFLCPRCDLPSGAIFGPNSTVTPFEHLLRNNDGADVSDYGWGAIDFWPSSPQPEIPENLPPEIARVYLQAERNFPTEGNEDASGTMYRKALDIGLKRIDPSLTGSLAVRIKKLASCGKVTAEIAEWSDCIRDIGNDAAHEETPLSRDELTDLKYFSDAVLRYLFSLPGMVKKRRGEKLDWE